MKKTAFILQNQKKKNPDIQKNRHSLSAESAGFLSSDFETVDFALQFFGS